METKEPKTISTEPISRKAQQSEQASAKPRIRDLGSVTGRHQSPPSDAPRGAKSNILLPTFIEIV